MWHQSTTTNKLCLFYVSCSFDFRTNAEFLRRGNEILDSRKFSNREFSIRFDKIRCRERFIYSVRRGYHQSSCRNSYEFVLRVMTKNRGVECSLESGFFFKFARKRISMDFDGDFVS